jgi:hypothetical protein
MVLNLKSHEPQATPMQTQGLNTDKTRFGYSCHPVEVTQ